MSAKPSRVRSKVRTQWLALGGALVVLAGVLVAWALTRAADRVQVVQFTHEMKAGDIIQADDLTLTGVAYDGAVQGLVPEASLDALLGRVATVDLPAGSLAQAGMWSDAPTLSAGEEAVGALLKVGHFPAGLARGDIAIAAPVDPTSETAPITVRVIDAEFDADGAFAVTLAVPADSAVVVAQLAANEQLLLVGQSTAVGS